MSILKKHWSQILFFLIILTAFIFISILLSADCSCSSNKIGESINCFITKTKDLWASIGSIATAISLIFIYLQLKVTKQQVLNANKPNLLMNDSIFEISFGEAEPSNIKLQSIKNYVHKINLLCESQGITVTNVGLGTAKSIVISWIYNLVEERSNNNQSINYLSKDSVYTIIPPFEYLASIIQSEIYVTSVATSALSGRVNSSSDGDGIEIPLNETNNLKLSLSYFDIYGEKVPQEFNVKVFVTVVGGDLKRYFVKMRFCEIF